MALALGANEGSKGPSEIGVRWSRLGAVLPLMHLNVVPHPFRSARRRRAGLSLVETVIAMGLLAIGALAATAAAIHGRRQAEDAVYQSSAQAFAQSLVDQVRHFSAGSTTIKTSFDSNEWILNTVPDATTDDRTFTVNRAPTDLNDPSKWTWKRVDLPLALASDDANRSMQMWVALVAERETLSNQYGMHTVTVYYYYRSIYTGRNARVSPIYSLRIKRTVQNS